MHRDFDTSAIGAFRDMKDALKDASQNTPEGKKERNQLAIAIIGLMLTIIAILLLIFMPNVADSIQFYWSK